MDKARSSTVLPYAIAVPQTGGTYKQLQAGGIGDLFRRRVGEQSPRMGIPRILYAEQIPFFDLNSFDSAKPDTLRDVCCASFLAGVEANGRVLRIFCASNGK